MLHIFLWGKASLNCQISYPPSHENWEVFCQEITCKNRAHLKALSVSEIPMV